VCSSVSRGGEGVQRHGVRGAWSQIGNVRLKHTHTHTRSKMCLESDWQRPPETHKHTDTHMHKHTFRHIHTARDTHTAGQGTQAHTHTNWISNPDHEDF